MCGDRVGVVDAEVDVPVRRDLGVRRRHHGDHVARQRLLRVAADVAGEAKPRDRAHGLGLPAEHRGVERGRGDGVRRVQRAHQPGVGLVAALRALALGGLPTQNAAPVGSASTASRPAGGKSSGPSSSVPPAACAAAAGIRALHPHVGAPDRGALGRQRADPGDVLAVEPRDDVAARPGLAELPSEQRAVEVQRRERLALQRVDPARRSGRVPHASTSAPEWSAVASASSSADRERSSSSGAT